VTSDEQPRTDPDLPSSGPARRWLPALLLAATATAIALFGLWHEPDYTLGLFGADYVHATRVKAYLTSVVLALAALQLLLALWIYTRLPRLGPAPRWAHVAHRTNGYLTVVVSAPIAVHCLLAYGFQTDSPRLALHSVAGTLLYGLFVAKVCVVRDRSQPAWVLPVLGTGLLVTIGLLWVTAALWVFNGYHLPLLD
jgi:hypothetical protein